MNGDDGWEEIPINDRARVEFDARELLLEWDLEGGHMITESGITPIAMIILFSQVHPPVPGECEGLHPFARAHITGETLQRFAAEITELAKKVAEL